MDREVACDWDVAKGGDMKHDEEGICPDPQCSGILRLPAVEDCACHINPPCSACVDNVLTCDKCGWEDRDEPYPWEEEHHE